MVYEVIVVDNLSNHHFSQVQHALKERYHGKFENPHIEKLWRDHIGHHDYLYHAHVKTGHFGNHHHFTVLWETKTHHGVEQSRLLDVQEGHKTLF